MATLPVLNDPYYEYYNTDVTNALYFQSNFWYAQTFAPSISHSITMIGALLRRNEDTSGIVTAHIRDTDATGKPTGLDRASGTINFEICPTVEDKYTIIRLSTCPLFANQTYALILDSDTFGCQWFWDSAGEYTGGSYWSSNDSGATWTQNADRDFGFIEYGTWLAWIALP